MSLLSTRTPKSQEFPRIFQFFVVQIMWIIYHFLTRDPIAFGGDRTFVQEINYFTSAPRLRENVFLTVGHVSKKTSYFSVMTIIFGLNHLFQAAFVGIFLLPSLLDAQDAGVRISPSSKGSEDDEDIDDDDNIDDGVAAKERKDFPEKRSDIESRLGLLLETLDSREEEEEKSKETVEKGVIKIDLNDEMESLEQEKTRAKQELEAVRKKLGIMKKKLETITLILETGRRLPTFAVNFVGALLNSVSVTEKFFKSTFSIGSI